MAQRPGELAAHHAPNVLLIPGTTNPGYLEENLAAGALTIDTATLAALDAIRAMA
jgi:pyridoxine 4-dehydrogenase